MVETVLSLGLIALATAYVLAAMDYFVTLGGWRGVVALVIAGGLVFLENLPYVGAPAAAFVALWLTVSATPTTTQVVRSRSRGL